MSDQPPAPPPPPPPPPPQDPGPPPPPSQGYGAPPTGSGGYSAPGAISYGWNKFSKSPGSLLVPVLVVLVIVLVIEVIVEIVLRSTLLSTHSCTVTVLGSSVQSKCGPGLFTSLFGSALAGLVLSLIAMSLGAGLVKCGLNVVDGKEVTLGDVFAYATKPNVVTAAAIVAVLTFIGTILCYLPGIIVGFLTMFTMFFVVDKDMAPMDAVRASFAFTTSHLGETLVFYILAVICTIIGAVVCLVGLLVAVPVVLVGAAYTFRMLHNEPVVA